MTNKQLLTKLIQASEYNSLNLKHYKNLVFIQLLLNDSSIFEKGGCDPECYEAYDLIEMFKDALESSLEDIKYEDEIKGWTPIVKEYE